MRPPIEALSRLLDAPIYGRLGIIGSSGCGKSSILRELLAGRRAIRQRVIAFDPWRDLWLEHAHSMAEALSALSAPWAQVGTDSPAIFAELAALAFRAGDALLVADEVQRLYPSKGQTVASAVCAQLVREGRHQRLPFIWATQRPTSCATDLTANTDGLVVGRLVAPADLAIAARWGIPEPSKCERHVFTMLLPGRELELVESARMIRSYMHKGKE